MALEELRELRLEEALLDLLLQYGVAPPEERRGSRANVHARTTSRRRNGLSWLLIIPSVFQYAGDYSVFIPV